MSTDQEALKMEFESPATVTFHAFNASIVPADRTINLLRGSERVPIGRSSKSLAKGLVGNKDNAWFDSPVMSREHAAVFYSEESKSVMIEDVGAMHGTFVNDNRIVPHKPYALRSDNYVIFGNEVHRGAETFPACDFRVSVKYNKPEIDDRFKGSPEPQARMSENAIRVPDYSDIDDEDSYNYISSGDDSDLIEDSMSGDGLGSPEAIMMANPAKDNHKDAIVVGVLPTISNSSAEASGRADHPVVIIDDDTSDEEQEQDDDESESDVETDTNADNVNLDHDDGFAAPVESYFSEEEEHAAIILSHLEHREVKAVPEEDTEVMSDCGCVYEGTIPQFLSHGMEVTEVISDCGGVYGGTSSQFSFHNEEHADLEDQHMSNDPASEEVVDVVDTDGANTELPSSILPPILSVDDALNMEPETMVRALIENEILDYGFDDEPSESEYEPIDYLYEPHGLVPARECGQADDFGFIATVPSATIRPQTSSAPTTFQAIARPSSNLKKSHQKDALRVMYDNKAELAARLASQEAAILEKRKSPPPVTRLSLFTGCGKLSDGKTCAPDAPEENRSGGESSQLRKRKHFDISNVDNDEALTYTAKDVQSAIITTESTTIPVSTGVSENATGFGISDTPRPTKRLKKFVEAIKYATLGGVAVGAGLMSILVASAPELDGRGKLFG